MDARKVCENCLHWRRLAEDGECQMARSANSIPLAPGTLAYAVDAEGREAALTTSAKFACSQWEQGEA